MSPTTELASMAQAAAASWPLMFDTLHLDIPTGLCWWNLLFWSEGVGRGIGHWTDVPAPVVATTRKHSERQKVPIGCRVQGSLPRNRASPKVTYFQPSKPSVMSTRRGLPQYIQRSLVAVTTHNQRGCSMDPRHLCWDELIWTACLQRT